MSTSYRKPDSVIYQHETDIRVRYSETDAMGRLHHANFLNYFELGRTEQLRSLGQTYREFEAAGLLLVVTKISVSYHRGARYDDLLQLITMTTRTTLARIDHEYALLRDNELIATASSTLACVDHQGQPQRLPEWLRISDR
jgi:acyl-CoA thioester hydrolase